MSLHILLVEPTRELSAMIAETLRRRGHFVTESSSPEQGKIHLESRSFVWVICSFRFPGATINGVDFLNGVRVAHPQVNRLLLSGRGNPGGHQSHFLEKPFRRSDFIELLEGIPQAAHQR